MHAATGSSRVWEHQMPAFTQAGYRVIAHDRRGWGRSVIDPSGPQPGTAADDLQALMDHLGIDRIHLVGTAAGAIASLDFALSFPQRLLSLVVANSIGGVQDEDYLALGRRLRPPQFDALPAEVRELGPSYRAADPEGTRRWIELGAPEPAGRASGTRRRRCETASRSRCSRGSRCRRSSSRAAPISTRPPPVLALFAARIRGAESVIVPEVGHSAYWEQPEIFNRAVLDFLGKHTPRRGSGAEPLENHQA